MHGDDDTGSGRRPIPSLAHALEEARARVRLSQPPDKPVAATAGGPVATGGARSGSLLDLAAPAGPSRPADRIGIARLAVEADAARRALAGRDARPADGMEQDVAEMRVLLDECLVAVRDCREMVRTLVTRRDRNYF